MNARCVPILLVVIGSLTATALARQAAAADPPAPACTRSQVEADWLRQDELRSGPTVNIAVAANVKPEEDAAGGVDGVKDGKWGFHTLNEPNPWWQVDLKQPTVLERIVLYNRCDSCGDRNTRIMVLAGDDGKTWKQLYQHNGAPFYGKTDGKPLAVPLKGDKARYIRLQLPGTSYFHLDEVEVYTPGSDKNIALGKPAMQSSISEWSVKHTEVVSPAAPQTYATARVIQRGRLLAASLRRLGAKIDADAAVLEQVAAQFEKLPKNTPGDVQRQLYFQAHWAVRRMALANPLLDFDKVLFAKRVPPAFPHMSDQYYGWWSRGGGGLCLLEGLKSARLPSPSGTGPKADQIPSPSERGAGGEGAATDAITPALHVRCITGSLEQGSFVRPDLSYDGRKVLFAYARFYPQMHGVGNKVNKDNIPEDAFYHVYEMNLDGSGLRKLTHGKYDDFDCRYLPSGEIVFLSTRKGQSIQVGKCSASATAADPKLPDSYVRCGGGDSRPVPVFTLQCMDGDGGNLRAISAFENFEWTPSVANDGRILYARWDYIDRFNGPFISLWSTNPDGTNPQLVYGNFTAQPQCVFEARSVPNSTKLVFTAAAHHSNVGGSLALLDRTLGTEYQRPLTRLTPEVCFPETEGWPSHYYADPYPLSEEFFLVAWSDKGMPPHTFVVNEQNPKAPTGIYLYDAFGNLELLHRDSAIGGWDPMPVRARPRPPVIPNSVAWDGPQQGRYLLQDVYQGLGGSGIARGSIKGIRVVAVPPKVQPYMNSPTLGVSAEDPGKFVLGTAPVESDGSAFFRVPSGVSLFFQALDEKGVAVQTMRSLTYVQANQTLACIGCHEPRDLAPPSGRAPLAALREPSRLVPGPEGSWPLRYDQLVQPVLDKHCVGCHKPGAKDPKGARFDLTPAGSYGSLLGYADKDLEKLAKERDRSIVGEMPARKSKLMALLTAEKGHEGVKLDADSFQRLVTWMDVYAQRQGHFSDQQEKDLRKLRQEWADLLVPAGPKP